MGLLYPGRSVTRRLVTGRFITGRFITGRFITGRYVTGRWTFCRCTVLEYDQNDQASRPSRVNVLYCAQMLLPRQRVLVVPDAGYAQSGNDRFLAYIPS
jgi:hypothetical protein